MLDTRFALTAVVGITLIVQSGCSKPDDDIFGEDAEADADDGFIMNDFDIPPGDGGDEVGESEPVEAPPGECLVEPGLNAFGYRHQCEGFIDLSFEGEAVVLGETYPLSGEADFSFGPGASNPSWWAEPDSYDNPLVAACCGKFDYAAPTLEDKTPYITNCVADSVQQVCIGIPSFLRRLADELPASEQNRAAKKKGIEDIADYVDDHTDDCFWSLFQAPPSPEWISSSELEGTTYSFCWTGNDCATFTLEQSAVYDWTTQADIPALVPEWAPCQNWEDNDTAVIPTAPLVIPGGIWQASGALRPGASAVIQSLLGSHSLGETLDAPGAALALSVASAGGVQIAQLDLSAGPASLSVGGESLVVHRARLHLASALEATPEGGAFVIMPRAAVFVATLEFDGGTRVLTWSNPERVTLRSDNSGWSFDPFSLEHVDGSGNVWSLALTGVGFDVAP